MASPAPHFHAFLRSVHRRLVVVRAAERTGLGVLAGCAAAGVLLPLLYWGGQGAVVPSLFLLGLGTIAGIAWGIASRPSVLVAAMEADRQLALADLLGTAAACDARPDAGDDPWRSTVLAVADDRCRQLAPSQVLLNRFGARAWGGIGLAAALVLTLAGLSGNPADLRATPARGTNGATAPLALRTADPQRARTAPAADLRPMSRARPDGPSDGGSSERPMTSDRPSPADTTAGKSNPSAPGRPSAAGDEGVGGGAGRARQSQPPRVSVTASDSSAPVSRAPDSTAGQQVGGSGRASAAQPSSRDPADAGGSSAGASAAPTDRVPPWHSQSWPADRRAAAEALDAGRVPDACRDLVRDYFDRP